MINFCNSKITYFKKLLEDRKMKDEIKLSYLSRKQFCVCI